MKRRVKLFAGGGILLTLFFLWSIYWGLSAQNISLIFNPHQVTPISPLYYIKMPRESLQSLFIFGDQDLSLWNFTLAKKRLAESQILASHNLKNAARNQIELAKIYQQKGNRYLNKSIDRIDTNFLVQFRDENQQMINSLSAAQ